MAILEVICLDDAEAGMAEAQGVDRIELIAQMEVGGLTPSYETMKQVVNAVHIPVYVMVRPHSDSFCYNQTDIDLMLENIRMIKKIGAAGIVIGALTSTYEVDMQTMRILLDAAEGLGITFHRAFDETTNQQEALRQLLQLNAIERILTSGGKPNVLDAVEVIHKLVQLTANTPISIMAGSGLNQDKLNDFLAQTGVPEVHMGMGVRFLDHNMPRFDSNKLQTVRRICSSSDS
jgi:copper homeostasis protein